MDMNVSESLFSRNANSTLSAVRLTYDERGGQYGDTWKDCQWLAMLATAGELGLDITRDECRVLAAAALVDVKYQRLQGGFKDDTLIDSISYQANWRAEMLKVGQEPEPQKPTEPAQV